MNLIGFIFLISFYELKFFFQIRKIVEFFCYGTGTISTLEVFSLRKKYELTDNYLCLMKLCTIFFIDYTSFEASFYIYELPFYEEFFYLISERSPCDTIRIFSLRERFSCRGFIVSICRYGKGRYLLIERGSCRLDKRIFRHISDKDDFIDSSHKWRDK